MDKTKTVYCEGNYLKIEIGLMCCILYAVSWHGSNM